jgi:hypothetical protein
MAGGLAITQTRRTIFFFELRHQFLLTKSYSFQEKLAADRIKLVEKWPTLADFCGIWGLIVGGCF